MTHHFAAFSFVDRIADCEPGRRARGLYAVPASVAAFPGCLVAEAVGQLAAWASMARLGFRVRPVAALATETRFLRDVAPGSELELRVDIASCDDDAVAYSGSARAGGSDVIELVDCLGPMLPVEDFDDPAALAARFELLRGAGAAPGRFGGLPALEPARTDGVRGVSAVATLAVPAAAPFFGDHFPRRPVFPATLLLDCQMRLAMALAAESTRWPEGTVPCASRMTHVKMRSFIPPGATIALDAELAHADDSTATIRLGARLDGRAAATARLEVVAKRAGRAPAAQASAEAPAP